MAAWHSVYSILEYDDYLCIVLVVVWWYILHTRVYHIIPTSIYRHRGVRVRTSTWQNLTSQTRQTKKRTYHRYIRTFIIFIHSSCCVVSRRVFAVVPWVVPWWNSPRVTIIVHNNSSTTLNWLPRTEEEHAGTYFEKDILRVCVCLIMIWRYDTRQYSAVIYGIIWAILLFSRQEHTVYSYRVSHTYTTHRILE